MSSLTVTLQFRSEDDLSRFVERVEHSGSVTVSSYTENEIPVQIVSPSPSIITRRKINIEYCCPVGECAYRGRELEVYEHIAKKHGHLYLYVSNTSTGSDK